MRLWQQEIIPYLPKSQLLAQWRELNSIFKKQDKHILIKYIYNYPKSYLKLYSDKVILEMKRRGYKIKSMLNYENYFVGVYTNGTEKFAEHNYEYLTICYWNLREKYLRGQKDFGKDTFNKLHDFYMDRWK